MRNSDIDNKVDYLEKHLFKRDNFETLKEMLYTVSEKYADKPAFKLKDENGKIYIITYKEFKADVEAVGTALLQKGLKGKFIAVVGKNSYTWSVSYLAACIVGIVVPIDKELTAENMITFLNESNASIILGDNKYLNNIFEKSDTINNKELMYIAFKDADLENINDSFISYDEFKKSGKKELTENNNNEFKSIEVDPDEMRFLLFTSGTTGNSKGVCLSHKNICSNIFSVGSIVKVDTHTEILSILPIHHTYECTLGYLLVISSGGNISYIDGYKHLAQNFLEYKPSIFLSVPLLLEKLHNNIIKNLQKSLNKKYFEKDPEKHIMDKVPFFMRPIIKNKIKKSFGGNLKEIIVGASPISAELITSLNKFGLTVLNGYGLTECSPLVAGNNDFFVNPASVGLPIPNVEYKINEPNDDGIGEIIVKGPNVMLGYYNNPEETNKVLKDGWFYTGDIGKIDDKGWLYITGRSKNVIITKNGKNVYPEEIEFLLDSDTFILESLVTGRLNKENKETYIKASIIPNIDSIKEFLNKNIKDISSKEIFDIISKSIKKVNASLPQFKHVKEFSIKNNEFEKTTTNKIKRFGKNLTDDDGDVSEKISENNNENKE